MNLSLNEEGTTNENYLPMIDNILAIDDILYKNINYKHNINYNNSDINNSSIDDSQMREIFLYKEKDEYDNQSQQYVIQKRANNYDVYANINMLKKSTINNYVIKESDKSNFLNKKRIYEKIFTVTKIPKEEKNKLMKLYRGRRKQSNNNRIHNLLSKDYIANKIKGHFFGFIRNIIEKNSLNGTIKFKKLQYKYITDLKKDKNEDLLKTKMRDILSNLPISKKYKQSKKDENKIIIDKIYKENKEKY